MKIRKFQVWIVGLLLAVVFAFAASVSAEQKQFSSKKDLIRWLVKTSRVAFIGDFQHLADRKFYKNMKKEDYRKHCILVRVGKYTLATFPVEKHRYNDGSRDDNVVLGDYGFDAHPGMIIKGVSEDTWVDYYQIGRQANNKGEYKMISWEKFKILANRSNKAYDLYYFVGVEKDGNAVSIYPLHFEDDTFKQGKIKIISWNPPGHLTAILCFKKAKTRPPRRNDDDYINECDNARVVFMLPVEYDSVDTKEYDIDCPIFAPLTSQEFESQAWRKIEGQCPIQ